MRRALSHTLILTVTLLALAVLHRAGWPENPATSRDGLLAQVVGPTGNSVSLEVRETAGVSRTDWPVMGQAPLPSGAQANVSNLRMLDSSGAAIPAQFQVSTTWPNGTIKLARYYFRVASLPANGAQNFSLSYGNSPPSVSIPNPLSAQDAGSEIVLTTTSPSGVVRLTMDKARFSLLKSAEVGGQAIWPVNTTSRGLFLYDEQNQEHTSLTSAPSYTLVEDGPLTKVYRVAGAIGSASNPFLTYTAFIRFHAGAARVDMESFRIENSGARTRSISGPHRRFKELVFKSDVPLTGTRSLDLGFYTKQNYTSEAITLFQDATPGKIDMAVTPSTDGPNDATPGNSYDNLKVVIREGSASAYSAGGVPTANWSGNTPLQPVPGTQSRGMLSYTNGSARFTSAFRDFWALNPKTIGMEGGVFKLGIFPRATPDLVHAQGPAHFVDPANPSNYSQDYYVACTNPSRSECNRFYAPDTQNYVLESGQAQLFRFAFTFDASLPNGPANFADAFQKPLIALPPPTWWGPQGANFLPFYVEARNWQGQAGIPARLQTVGEFVDRWGRSLFDPTAICQSSSYRCITAEERLPRGGEAFDYTGMIPFHWDTHGEHQWGGVQPDRDAYGILEGYVVSALRNRDPRGITIPSADRFTVSDVWHGGSTATEWGRRYQSGDWTHGDDPYPNASRRHSPAMGEALYAIVTGDHMARDATLVSTSRIQQGQTGSFGVDDEIAHRGKSISSLAFLYYMTADAAHLQTARQMILATKSLLDDCRSRYGFPLPPVTYGNTCTFQTGGGSWGSQQVFMIAYLMRGLMEFDAAWLSHYGTRDSAIYPWTLQILADYHREFAEPFASPATTFAMPKSFVIFRGSIPPTQAQMSSICGIYSNQQTTPQALTGGTEPAYLVGCFIGTELYNAPYLLTGLAWLYRETGSAAVAETMEDIIYDAIVNQTGNPYQLSSPSWKPGTGIADIKQHAPLTHELHQVYAALVGPTGGATIPTAPPAGPVPPSAPANLVATPGSQTVVNLSWTDTSSNETGFVVERASGAGGSFFQIATLGANVTTYADQGASAGATYQYRVYATGSAGNSGYSYPATVTTPGGSSGQQPPLPASPSQTGLVLYLPMGEGSGGTVADASPSGLTGTLQNGPQWQSGACRTGLGSCLQFDGANDYVAVPDHPSLNPTTALSVAAWVNPSLANAGVVLGKGAAGGEGQFYLRLLTGRVRLGINGNAFPEVTASVPAGAWTHLAVSYSGSQVIFYVNGIAVGNPFPLTAAVSPTDGVGMSIGRRNATLPNQFSGLIDEVALWNRALLPSEIVSLSQGASPLGGAGGGPSAPFAFTLASGGSVSLARGSSAQATLTAALAAGSAQLVNFSASGLPSGVTASFAPQSCSVSCSTLLTLNASSGASLGPASVTVQASGGGASQSATVPLTVVAAGAMGGSGVPSLPLPPPPGLGGPSGGAGLPAPGAVGGPGSGLAAPAGAPALAAPLSLRGSRAAVGRIRIEWDYPGEQAQAFTLERSTSSGQSGFAERGVIPGQSNRIFDDSAAVLPGSRLFYRMRASNIVDGYSGYSSAIEMAPVAETLTPMPPTNFAIRALLTTYPTPVRFTWNDNALIEWGASAYDLHWSLDGNAFSQVAVFPANTTGFTYHGARFLRGTRYHYKIRACNARGCSAFSNVSSFTTPGGAAPPPPQGLQAPGGQAPPAAPAGPPYQFIRNLRLGETHADVRALQRCLNAKGFPVASSGPGSSGSETAYFGSRTKSAVITLQNAHRAAILAPASLSSGTGFVGPATRAYLNSISCPQ